PPGTEPRQHARDPLPAPRSPGREQRRCLRGSTLQTNRGRTAMKPRRRKRQPAQGESVALAPTTIFSSDLLTPEEERELLASFWETKSELVRVLKRHFPRLRQHQPPLEPWPMAQFIRDYCGEEARQVIAVRRVHDRYIHYKHR